MVSKFWPGSGIRRTRPGHFFQAGVSQEFSLQISEKAEVGTPEGKSVRMTSMGTLRATDGWQIRGMASLVSFKSSRSLLFYFLFHFISGLICLCPYLFPYEVVLNTHHTFLLLTLFSTHVRLAVSLITPFHNGITQLLAFLGKLVCLALQ